MSKLIDSDNVLRGIEELKKSPWYNDGKDFPFIHLAYIARKEAVQVIYDLCIKQEPAVDAIPVEWLREMMIKADDDADTELVSTISWLIRTWQKEQEAKHEQTD